MRINLPGAILLSGTVLLLSGANVYAQSTAAASSTATPTSSSATTEPNQAAVDGKSQTSSATSNSAANTSSDSKAAPAAATNMPAPETQGNLAQRKKSKSKARPGNYASIPGIPNFPDKAAPFQFSKMPDAEIIHDPADAVEKARALHAKAMDQAKVKAFDDAAATEKQAIAAAPHYWLPHAGMVFIMLKQGKKPHEAINEANLSLYGKPGAVAQRNAGKLFESLHWTPPALKALVDATNTDPNNWQGWIALTDAWIAQNNLESAQASIGYIKPECLKQPECLEAIGVRQLMMNNPHHAIVRLEEALALNPDAALKQDCNQYLFVASMMEGDASRVSQYFRTLTDEYKASSPELVLQAKSILIKDPSETDALLKEAANLQNAKSDQAFFLVCHALLKKADNTSDAAQQKAWLLQAREAVRNAIVRNATDAKYRVAEAAIQDRLGDVPGVRQTLADMKESIPQGTDSFKPTIDTTPSEMQHHFENIQKLNLVKAFPLTRDTGDGTMTAAYHSNARELQIQILKASCSCHARSLKRSMDQQPGVFYTAVSKDKMPIISVFYDSKQNNEKKLMATKIIESIGDPTKEVGDKPVDSIKVLSDLVIDQVDTKPVLAKKQALVLEAPFDPAGQVAQATDTDVR